MPLNKNSIQLSWIVAFGDRPILSWQLHYVQQTYLLFCINVQRANKLSLSDKIMQNNNFPAWKYWAMSFTASQSFHSFQHGLHFGRTIFLLRLEGRKGKKSLVFFFKKQIRDGTFPKKLQSVSLGGGGGSHNYILKSIIHVSYYVHLNASSRSPYRLTGFSCHNEIQMENNQKHLYTDFKATVF